MERMKDRCDIFEKEKETKELTMKNRFTMLSSLILLATSISGCSYDYYFKDEGIVAQQRKLFNQLCNAEDRSIIHQTAEVEGYLSADREYSSCLQGWNPIFEYGYKYAECTTTKLAGHELPKNAEIYRFSLESDTHPDCGTGETHFSNYSRRTYRGSSPSYKDTNLGNHYMKKHKSRLEEKCLVVKKVETPMSRYMVLHDRVYIDEGQEYYIDEIYKKYHGNYEQKKGMITRVRDSVIDLETGQSLAKYSNYGFAPKNLSHAAGLGVSEGCEGGRNLLSPEEVLIPKATDL